MAETAAVNREISRLFRQPIDEIGLRFLHAVAQFPTVECGQIEPVDGGFARTNVFRAFFLHFFHFLDLFQNLMAHKSVGFVEHFLGVG